MHHSQRLLRLVLSSGILLSTAFAHSKTSDGALAESAFQNVPIKSIHLEADGAIDVPALTQVLGLKEGDPYSRAALEAGLSHLAELGKFSAVRSHFDIVSGALVIELKLIESLAGVDISIVDKNPPSFIESDVQEVIGVSTGDAIYVDLFDEIRGRIKARLQDRGYLNAEIALALEQRDQSSSRKLLVTLNLGTRTRIRSFQLRGFSGKDAREFFNYLKDQSDIEQFFKNLKLDDFLHQSTSFIGAALGKGNAESKELKDIQVDVPLDWLAVSAAISKWGAESRNSGFYDFSVKAAPLDETFKDDSVVVQVSLNRGLKYRVQFLNNVVFWERDLRSRVLDRTLRLGVPFSLTDAEAIVRRAYESQGYREVHIHSSSVDTSERRDITITVDEGKQFYLGTVKLEGVSDAEAIDLQGITKAWIKPLDSPLHHIYYDESLLKSRLSDLLKAIRKRGFLQARILEYRKASDSGGRFVDIEIPIQLGPRYFVGTVSVVGNRVLSEAELDHIVTYEPGKAVDPEKLIEISGEIRRRYQSFGFPFVKVSDEEKQAFKVKPETADVDIEIRVDPGPQITIGKIYVQGLKKTKDEVVLRELHQEELEPGKIWRTTAQRSSEERLLGLGIFNSARFETSGGRILERASGDGGGIEKQEKDLRVQMTERNAGAFEFGPGYRTDLGLVASAEFNYRNLGGLNRGVLLRAQVSRKLENYVDLEQKYSASFVEPYIYRDPTRLRFNMAYELDDQYVYEKNVRIQGFMKSELSFGVAADRAILENLRITHNIYTFSLPVIINPVGTVVDNRYRIGTMGTTLTYDSRDNFFNPTRGLVGVASFEYSAPWIASDNNANFLIGRVTFGSYIPTGGGSVFATNLTYARMWGLGQSEGIPENKRLVLGGLASVRSISEGGLQSPAGGLLDQESYLAKFEYRQPVLGDFGLAFFADFGILHAIRYASGPTSAVPVNTGLRSGVGIGFRYISVVGPLAFDVVYNPDPKEALGNDTLRFLLSVGTF